MLAIGPDFCLAAITAAMAIVGVPPAKPVAVDVSVKRLDCGTGDIPKAFYSTKTLKPVAGTIHGVVSCYLIRHGREFLLWDAGLSPSYMVLGAAKRVPGFALSSLLTTQLRTLGVEPSQVRFLAISHLHFDHVGQAASFPEAILLADERDLAALKSKSLPMGLEDESIRPWLNGRGRSKAIQGDIDIFGDESAVLLATPGHTEGHHSLFVRRIRKPPVILAGDLWHAGFQMRDDAVSQRTQDPVALRLSRKRILKIAHNTHAVIVIGHDPSRADIE